MIRCVGEILVDMIGEYHDNVFSYQRRAGGAPFNVSCAITKFGGKSSFYGAVGDDIIGKFLIEYIKKQNVINNIKVIKIKRKLGNDNRSHCNEHHWKRNVSQL